MHSRNRLAKFVSLLEKKSGRDDDKPCPGSKIRSKGKGKGLGYGKGRGKGPIGVPKESSVDDAIRQLARALQALKVRTDEA